MSRRSKQRGMKTPKRVDFDTGNPNRLMARAEVCELLYGTLLKNAPEDDEGIKTAYITLDNDGDSAMVAPSQSAMDLYGIKPVRVAEFGNPWPMIPTQEGPPQFSNTRTIHRGLLRQVLSKIVDEA